MLSVPTKIFNTIEITFHNDMLFIGGQVNLKRYGEAHNPRGSLGYPAVKNTCWNFKGPDLGNRGVIYRPPRMDAGMEE
jgi:hypothetical protein